MWDIVFNILKITGSFAAIVGAVIVAARLWHGAIRERLIKLLESELALSREHRVEADKDSSKSRVTLDEMKEHLQKVQVENAGLISRPDFTSLSDLLKGQSRAMESIGEVIRSHSESDAKTFSTIIEKFDAHNVAAEERTTRLLAPVQAMCSEVVEALRNGTPTKKNFRPKKPFL